jgi:hypothetical protein
MQRDVRVQTGGPVDDTQLLRAPSTNAKSRLGQGPARMPGQKALRIAREIATNPGHAPRGTATLLLRGGDRRTDQFDHRRSKRVRDRLDHRRGRIGSPVLDQADRCLIDRCQGRESVLT